MIVGSRIKEERLKLNLTQEELGKLIGVSKTTISYYENGLEQPKMDKLKKPRNESHLKTKVDTYQKNLEIDKKRWKKEQVKESNTRTWKNISYIGSHGVNIFSLVVVILISVTLIRILYSGSGDIVSFGSLLDILRDAPQVSTSVRNFTQTLQFTEPWDILDSIRLFLNNLSNIVSILAWLFASLIDVVLFIVYFLKWIFI